MVSLSAQEQFKDTVLRVVFAHLAGGVIHNHVVVSAAVASRLRGRSRFRDSDIVDGHIREGDGDPSLACQPRTPAGSPCSRKGPYHGC